MKYFAQSSKIWVAFVTLKVAYMLFGLFVFANVTTLGDTGRYLEGGAFSAVTWYLNSTEMMDVLASSFGILGGPVFANLPFVFLSTFGVYYSVKRLNLHDRETKLVLLMLSLPSFGIWTSIASKEAVAVFFLGGILGFLIDLIKGNKKNYVFLFLSLYLCAIFKPQYLVGIFALFFFIYVDKIFSLKLVGKVILFFLFLLVSFLSLYIYREEINQYSFLMPAHFTMDADSTRQNDIWLDDFDVFWNAPYGIFIAFVGPTLSEALSKQIHFYVFLESCFILLFFSLYSIKILIMQIKYASINFFFPACFFIVVSWILFVNYPFGVLNPGSAVRYRQNFYAFLIVLFYFCYIEIKRNLNCAKFFRRCI
jgi:hypothetical protein